MSVAWIDASAGASGDMLLAALLDAGASLEAVRTAIAAVGVEPVAVRTDEVRRAGLRALRAHVDVTDDAMHRTWADLRGLLTEAPLDPAVRASALRTFALLAEAEARAHGMPVDDVHFHEVGALDAIADVVGVCAALQDLRIAHVACSTVTVGSGSVTTAHGSLPVPVPAVVLLLAGAGLPSAAGPSAHEACTPTGAALLAAYADTSGPQPPMTVRAVGVGAGGRDTPGAPNVLRVLVGDPVPETAADGGAHEEVVLETNVDDMDPRLWPGVLQSLLAAGAADAWLTPILMKKGRPAHTLHVLCGRDVLADVRRVVVTHTSTIGVREHLVAKRPLPRETRTVDVRGHAVRVKVALDTDGVAVTAQPEFDDVAAVADASGVPPRVVLAEAITAAVVAGTDR